MTSKFHCHKGTWDCKIKQKNVPNSVSVFSRVRNFGAGFLFSNQKMHTVLRFVIQRRKKQCTGSYFITEVFSKTLLIQNQNLLYRLYGAKSLYKKKLRAIFQILILSLAV